MGGSHEKSIQIYKFLKSCLGIIKSARVAIYSNKFSKHTYTQHQLLAILCLMKYLKQHYRDIVDILTDTERFTRLLKLKSIPHFTTLQKFFKRFYQKMLDKILYQSLKLFQLSIVGVAVDATGYDSDFSSKYYSVKIKGCCFRRNYSKDSIAVDVRTQVILANKSSRAPRHENKDFKPLLRKVCRQLDVDYVSADKGYDDANNREWFEERGVRCNIPIRKYQHNKTSRLKQSLAINEKEYHQSRNCIFSH